MTIAIPSRPDYVDFLGDRTIRLYRGDSTGLLKELAQDVALGIEDAADLVLTDPPYGIRYQGGSNHKRLAYDEAPHVSWVPEMAALMKPNTAMYMFSRGDVADVWRAAMVETGLTVKDDIIWDKLWGTQGDCLAAHSRRHELIIVAHKGRALFEHWTWGEMPNWPDEYLPQHINLKTKRWEFAERDKLIKRDSTVWSYPVPRDKESQDSHPTPKPPEIMERAMLGHSPVGGLVLDPFAGGGPVGVAAVRQKRRYIGIEIDSHYFEIARANICRELDRKDVS